MSARDPTNLRRWRRRRPNQSINQSIQPTNHQPTKKPSKVYLYWVIILYFFCMSVSLLYILISLSFYGDGVKCEIKYEIFNFFSHFTPIQTTDIPYFFSISMIQKQWPLTGGERSAKWKCENHHRRLCCNCIHKSSTWYCCEPFYRYYKKMRQRTRD